MNYTATITDLRQRLEAAEAALAARASESIKFRALMSAIDAGFCVLEMLEDASGQFCDFRYVDVNDAFETQTGLRDVVGRTASMMVPGTERHWIDNYGEIVRTGASKRFENYHEPTGRWYDVHAFRLGQAAARHVGILFCDITARKQAEAILREAEQEKEFLLKLADNLRPLASPEEITAQATRLLGEWSKASRCYYVEWQQGSDYGQIRQDYAAEGLPSLAGRYPNAAFQSSYARISQGSPWIVEDAAIEPELDPQERDYFIDHGVHAWINVPLIKHGQIQAALCLVQAEPRKWTANEVSLAEETADRCWGAIERSQAEAGRRESEARFSEFAASSPDMLWIRRAKTLDAEYLSPAVETIFGTKREDAQGGMEQWAALIVPEDREEALASIERVRNGEAVIHEFRIRRPSDGAFRWIRNHDFPLRDGDHVKRIGGIATDVTDIKLYEERQDMLLAELQHRVLNIVSKLRSIITRTRAGAQSVPEFEQLLSGRFMALARTQGLLTRKANEGVDLATLVRAELASHADREEQYRAGGPDIVISPKAAEVLCLALHELATNALKHGALSVSDGCVEVRWSLRTLNGEPKLRLDWIERRPPPANWTPPVRRGFGTELIEHLVPYELQGRGSITFKPEGIDAMIAFPLRPGASILETGAPSRTSVSGGSIDMTGEPSLAGQTVLVLEDDFFIAHDIASSLADAGATVAGSFSTMKLAQEALQDARISSAVLDVNLGDGPSFAIAKQLRETGTPFVFITGYDATSLPPEFADAPRLQKPVEPRLIVRTLAAFAKTVPAGE